MKLVPENINEVQGFVRNIDPKSSMRIGKAANPYRILVFTEEYSDNGPVLKYSDVVEAEENTWDREIDDFDEVDDILSNWVEKAHNYYGAWILENPDDRPEDSVFWHARDMENNWFKFYDNTYYIPKKLSLNESQSFERGQDPKKSMNLGFGDPLEALKIYEKILSIINDTNYPSYMDNDIEGDPQEIRKIGDIYSIIFGKDHYKRSEFYDEYFFDVSRSLGLWETGDAPSDRTFYDIRDSSEVMILFLEEELGI